MDKRSSPKRSLKKNSKRRSPKRVIRRVNRSSPKNQLGGKPKIDIKLYESLGDIYEDRFYDIPVLTVNDLEDLRELLQNLDKFAETIKSHLSEKQLKDLKGEVKSVNNEINDEIRKAKKPVIDELKEELLEGQDIDDYKNQKIVYYSMAARSIREVFNILSDVIDEYETKQKQSKSEGGLMCTIL